MFQSPNRYIDEYFGSSRRILKEALEGLLKIKPKDKPKKNPRKKTKIPAIRLDFFGCFTFIDDRELDQPQGLLVSNALRCHFVKIWSIYIFEKDQNRYRKECASRTIFHEAYRYITIGLLRKHKREMPLCRIHRKSFSFRLYS